MSQDIRHGIIYAWWHARNTTQRMQHNITQRMQHNIAQHNARNIQRTQHNITQRNARNTRHETLWRTIITKNKLNEEKFRGRAVKFKT